MQLGNLIDSANIRGLVILDDEKGVHVCHNFDDTTVLLSFDRRFLEASSNRLIMSMIDERLAALEMLQTSSALTIQANGANWGEIRNGVVTPGYNPRSRLRRAAWFLKDTLTRIVFCGILLLYIDW